MSSPEWRHPATSNSQPVRVAVWPAVPLFLAIVLLATLQTATRSEPPTGDRSDGAPGENRAPGEVVLPGQLADRFAQVGKDEDEPKDGDIAEVENDKPAPDDAEVDDAALDDAAVDEADPRNRRNLDNIDFRAPINRTKQAVWQKIEQAAQGRDWKQVLERLDRFAGPVDRPESEDYLVRQADGSLRSSRLSIARLLASMPENVRAARTRTEATLGNTFLEQAIRENSLRQLSQVAVRFSGTPVGYRAADRLASQLIDRGEFALAAQWLKLLRDSDSKINQSADWQNKTRLILDLIGKPQKSAPPSGLSAQLREQFVTTEPASLSHWPLLGGNSRRHAEPDATSRPVMIRRWEFASTSNSRLKSTIERLISDLAWRSVPTVPAGAPIFVDGKLVCRTFRGIEVLDVESGQHLWTTAKSASVERLLGTASPNSLSGSSLNPGMLPILSATAAVDRTGGPIGQFLFQNAAHGLISSDGQLVYFLEDDPVFTLGRTSLRRIGGGNASPRPDSATSNRLKAYDLQSGKPAWQIGGPATSEPFAPELAGWFFLGAPLPDRGDLFVVGQKENAIRLFCLDPKTGSARWSQQIAFAEEGLERNLNRRLWSVQLAAAHGVIVCPTSVGWLVGVDRSTGTLVWSHRYSERQNSLLAPTPRLFRGNQSRLELANETIGGTWVPAAPVIMGDHIVYTPPEPRDESDSSSRFLECVNVFTGESVWSLPRDQALAINGASRGQTIVTRTNAVVILKSDGSTRAEIPFDSADGLPCGRGVVAQGSFWLPLQKHVLLRFDIEQASLADRIELAAGYPPLGNLAFYQGMLISHAPEGISAWELEDTLGLRLAAIRSAGDSDKADILEAQVALSRKEYSAAIKLLLPRLSANPNAGLHQSILRLLMQAAAGQVAANPKSGLALLTQVQPLFESSGLEGANLELQRRQLEIEALLRLKRPVDAFDRLLKLVAMNSSGTMKRVDDPRITVAVDPWLSRQLQRVWLVLSATELSAAERSQQESRIEQLFGQSGDAAKSNLRDERLANLFEFHSGSLKLAQSLADKAVAEDRFADAEHWLGRIAESGSDSQAADALLRRVRLSSKHGVANPDTLLLIQRLQSDYASVALPDGTLVSAALPPLLEALGQTSGSSSSDWGDIKLTSVRTAASQERERSPRLIADRPSSRFRIETLSSGAGSSRLSFFDRATDELFWTVSLRSNNGSIASGTQPLTVFQTGQLFPVLSRGVLNMLSVPERRVLWTQPVHELDSARRSPRTSGHPLEEVADWMLRLRPGTADAVPVVNSSYLCSRASRSLTVFDSRTGELRWRLEPFERSLRVFGTHDTIYLTRPDGTVSAAHNAVDGESVEPGQFVAQLPESATIVKVDDHAIVTVTREEEELTTIFRAQSPATQRELWSHTVSGKIKLRLISNNQLAILAPGGLIKLLDLRTGNLTEFDKLIPSTIRIRVLKYRVLADDRILYVILNRAKTVDANKPGLPSVFLSGNLAAFDLKSGKLLWTQELSRQHLLTERLDQLPFLITTSYRREFTRQPPDVRRVIVLDKRDGKVLLDTKNEPGEASFHSMIIDTDNRQVDLISSLERLRLKSMPVEDATGQ